MRKHRALTDATLRALKPEDKPYEEYDGHGLVAEVRPTGTIVFRFRYRLNGRAEKLTLGKYPDLTLKRARDKRDEAARKVADGVSPREEKRREKRQLGEAITVAEFGERYFRLECPRKDPTIP